MVDLRGKPIRRHTGVGVIARERDELRKRERPSVPKRSGVHHVLEVLLGDRSLDLIDALVIVRLAHYVSRQILPSGDEIYSDVH